MAFARDSSWRRLLMECTVADGHVNDDLLGCSEARHAIISQSENNLVGSFDGTL